MQSNKIHKVFYDGVLFITYVRSTCFGPHWPIFRSIFYKLYVQIWYVVLLYVLHTKSAHTACKKCSWRWTSEVRNMSSEHTWWIKLHHKTLCVSCWTAYILRKLNTNLRAAMLHYYDVLCFAFYKSYHNKGWISLITHRCCPPGLRGVAPTSKFAPVLLFYYLQ